MRFLLFVILILTGLPLSPTHAQQTFRIMSYNVENLFDTINNPQTNDDEFLPEGAYHWTNGRYRQKLRHIAKAIAAAGEWDTPALIGLCEVENDSVLKDLSQHTQLRKQNYHFVVTHGPDRRGINVALMYQRDRFALLGQAQYRIALSGRTHSVTRDILHVWGKVLSGDTLDVCVCHFPSRSGGEKETEPDRVAAAEKLRSVCDSLAAVRRSPFLILMGDFNDTYSDKSIRETLQARALHSHQEIVTGKAGDIVDLFANPKLLNLPGSHKYQGQWSQLDHILVNLPMLREESNVRFVRSSMQIFSPSFLMTDDATHFGSKPLRSFNGMRYANGYSDHLPLIIDLTIAKP